MKCSELWLREWVNPTLNKEELCQVLTMAGLEVEDLTPVSATFSNIVIGQILKIDKHPEANRLYVCEVDVGKSTPLHIVCGANNVKIGMKVPVALIGAHMPDKTIIKPTSIRGVASEGMLCSAAELGLSEESDGLLELPQDASIGKDLKDYFKLDDYIIDISITPNRGDCLSVRGIAREIAALTHTSLKDITISEIKSSPETLSVTIESSAECPRYVGRLIRRVNAQATTPVWLKERLRRSGVRAISPIVDVTNYVMLELGQPMHAFDLDTVENGINVRQAKLGEKIVLLDGSEKILNAETLVIADHQKPLAIAGVMGGMDSSVTLLTQNIFLESAYFSPQTVARQRQYYGLSSESAYRFERGVDPTIQRQAIERATQLILEIAGGEAGEVIDVMHTKFLPDMCVISLSSEKVANVLGITIPDQEIEAIFDSLKFNWQRDKKNWLVHVPPYRFDIELPEDLIEEIARLYGYDKIPTHSINAALQANKVDTSDDLSEFRQAFCHLGYHEIISYSFIDKKLQHLLDPNEIPREILNPISIDMAVMRTNLWPGLVNTLLYNKSRQQHRVRLFEIGTCFVTRGNEIVQNLKLGGLISGFAYPEQWGMTAKEVDFFDLKGDLENLLSSYFKTNVTFVLDDHPALHPNQAAAIYHQDKKIGILGALHPSIFEQLDLTNKVFMFELDLSSFKNEYIAHIKDISKFPEIRRDIAILVNQAIPVKDIQDTIKMTAGDWLKDVFIFDVYQGKGISPGLKSIALALIMQHPTRTLVDDEVTERVDRVIETLIKRLGAELRR